MSELPRIALPSNADFGLAEVSLMNNPVQYTVAAPELPGRTEDELRHAAEQGDWDLYTTHGIDEYPLSYRALRSRFQDIYVGDRMDEPGGFIKAVLGMQRTIPNAKEYAAKLAADDLIRPGESAIVPDEFSAELLRTDEGAEQARAHFKVLYLANAVTPDARTAKLAAEYASDRIKMVGGDERAQRRASERMLQARGVEGVESSFHSNGRLRRLGMTEEQISQLDAAPVSGGFARFSSPHKIVEGALTSASLDRQVAYRQFFGMQNLANLATAHAVVERPFDSQSLAFSSYAIGMGMAGSQMVQSNVEKDKPFVSTFLNEVVALDLGGGNILSGLGALASFMMREPALNGRQDHIYPRSDFLGHNVVNMITTDYRVWLDRRIAQEG
jgi:hypothetical protein